MPLGAARLSLLAYQAAAAATGRTAVAITAINDAQVSTAQSKFGTGSLLLDGTSDYLKIDQSYNNLFSLDDFTMEAWIYQNNNTGFQVVVSNWEHGFILAALNGNNLRMYINASLTVDATGLTFATNSWHHVAATRSGSDVKLWLNGTQVGSTGTASSTISVNDFTGIGINVNNSPTNNPNGYWNGYIDELRISDTPRYTSGFTPSTTAFANDSNTVLLVHMDGTNGSTTFTDDVVTPLATGGTFSTYNDGTNDYAIHTLTSSDTFTPLQSLNIDTLIVAGGGGGGSSDAGNIAGGGGGGAQVRYQSGVAVTAQNYTITIGNGGAAGANGSDSSAFGYTSEGGGGGGGAEHQTGNSRTDAAGGGGGGHWQSGKAGGTGTYAGGAGTDGPEIGGAGGGNGGVGSTASGQSGGTGGIGISTTDTFASGTQYYGGGGGGGGLSSWPVPGIGAGTHGGGNGSKTAVGDPATAGSGSGGGGGGYNKAGGTGGSGVVIVRYQL